MSKPNTSIRDHARSRGVCLWQVADALGINESSLSRLLRYELSEEKSREIVAAINRLAAEVMQGV